MQRPLKKIEKNANVESEEVSSKRGRGRPPKNIQEEEENIPKKEKRGRGRPRKNIQDENIPQTEKRGRGRPPKKIKDEINKKEVEEDDEIFLPVGSQSNNDNDFLDFEDIDDVISDGKHKNKVENNMLPEYDEANLDEEEYDDEFELPRLEDEDENEFDEAELPGLEEDDEEEYDDEAELPGLEEDDEEDYDDEVELPGIEDEDDEEEYDDEAELPGLEEEDEEEDYDDEAELPGIEDEDDEEDYEDEAKLPGIEDDEDEIYDDDEYELPGFDDEESDDDNSEDDYYEEDYSEDDYDDEYDDDEYQEDYDDNTGEKSNFQGPIRNVNFNRMELENGKNNESDENSIEQANYKNNGMNANIDNLLTGDNKIVSFVGTSKNGTSFLVNNLAQMLSEKGIKTAILDLTQNRNAYYIYTDNREELRNISFRCIENLRKGIAEGIQVNKNLTVYTSLPDDIDGLKDSSLIIETLLNNYSLVLLDCDFMTDLSYFNIAQEIYLVQSMDVLTIQPLTAFLRELKAKNILDQNKLRVIFNKYVKSEITEKMIMGGMSSYNDPSMSFMTELFDKDKMKSITIPFEIQNYSRYLEALVDCKISLKGYSKNFIKKIEELGNMVFPLIYNSKGKNYNNYNNNFSKNTNNTLNKMKKKY